MKDPLFPDTLYHVYTHANGQDNLFKSNSDYNTFLLKYHKYISPIADTYAYVLMPNHLHIMIKIRTSQDLYKITADSHLKHMQFFKDASQYLSQQFSNLFNSHTKSFNAKYKRKGSLFIPNFKCKMVTDPEYITSLIGYIHNNPVHHNFCSTISGWPHSSIHAYLTDKPTKINKMYLEKWFGNRDQLIKFHAGLQKVNLEKMDMLR